MKKALSVLLSTVIGISALCTFSCAAAGSSTADKSSASGNTVSAAQDGSIVVFGDSIASGYGLDPDAEYNYGQICADYLGYTVENYAVSGDTTSDLLNVISSLDEAQKNSVAGSEIVIISIGGNDLMQYAAKKILIFAAEKNLMKEGYTAENIPENPSITHLLLMLDTDAFMEYANGGLVNMLQLNTLLSDIAKNLRFDTSKYEGYIPKTIIPNIESAVAQIKQLNPDARIIVQTIYQPLQLDPAYIEAEYGSNSNYSTVIGQIRSNFNDILYTFSDELYEIDGIEIADVFTEFTSLPDDVTPTAANPGYAHYFTDIQESGMNRDFHPNQKGHLAIAATVLKTIGELHDDSGLLTQVYTGLSDASSYPALALDTYKEVAGNFMLGDVNFDLKVDARDASLVLRDYADTASGLDTSLSKYQQKAASVNSDDAIDARDASSLLRYYAFISSGGELSFEDFIKQDVVVSIL